MDLHLILIIISYCLFLASLIAIPLKRKNILSIAGNCLYGFPKNKKGMLIGVDIVALILITILIFIKYTVFVSVVLCACGVLGAWIIVGEAALGSYYGIYDNGIIAVGKFIPFDDIVTFPVFNLPVNEQKNHPGNVLVIASRKYGNVEIVFDNDDVCNNVVKLLKELGMIK